MGERGAVAMQEALRPISTAVDAQLQALADVFVKDEWSPQVAIQKMEYQLEKHNAIVRSAMQVSVDGLVEHWMQDQDELQQNEKDQLGHLEASLEKERARQAAARKRAAEVERLKAEELSIAAERQMQLQAKLAEAAAESDAREARKALEDAMQLEMDMAETELRREFAERSLASTRAHEASVAVIDNELERLQDNSIQAINLGRSEEELAADLAALQAEVSELERLIQAEQEVSDEKIKARTEETEQVERRTQLQRDTMRADIIQAEAHFEKEEMHIKGMLSTLSTEAVTAEKREFMRLLQREKRRATYLKAAKAVKPQEVRKAKAAAERRLQSVAALQKAQQPTVSSPPRESVAGAGDAAATFFAATSASPLTL